jgi:hypothetical protein
MISVSLGDVFQDEWMYAFAHMIEFLNLLLKYKLFFFEQPKSCVFSLYYKLCEIIISKMLW